MSVFEKAAKDTGLQKELRSACSLSILYWINTFVYTDRLFRVDENGVKVNCNTVDERVIPMITWDIQDTHLLKLQAAIQGGNDLLTDKTREMGATWNHIAVLDHGFQFLKSQSYLMMSRKEEAVDEGKKNYSTLFGKCDFIHDWQPNWLTPNITRTHMHLVNNDLSSRIDGESANATAGSSDRRTAVFMDEAAKMDRAESIFRSIRDVTASLLVCSTPNGPGTAYSKLRQSGRIPVFILPWWEHPEKGLNRYVVFDEELKRWKIRSPWYDNEEKIRSPKEMAIEIDMDHIGSGDTYFEAAVVEQHRSMFSKRPRHEFQITLDENIPNQTVAEALKNPSLSQIKKKRIKNAPLKVWTQLIFDRLDQTKTYTLGVDIGKGQGASNSTISVLCNETNEKVAEWASAHLPPYDFARVCVAVAIWVGGQKGLPFIIWEANGDPGIDFGRNIYKIFNYPYVYVDESVGKLTDKKSQTYGFHSSREKKEALLSNYRRLLAQGGYVNPSEQALDEALVYIYYENGGIGPSELLEENANARATHGDRVIADALSLWPSRADKGIAENITPKAPHGSFAWRKTQFKRPKKKKKNPSWRQKFNFGSFGN